MAYELLSALAGLIVGALVTGILLMARLHREQDIAQLLRTQRDEATKAQVQLAELRLHLSTMRHDVRGILSPALLVADRLVSSEEASIKRAGEVMIRTVERAVSRLAETRQDQDCSNAGQQ